MRFKSVNLQEEFWDDISLALIRIARVFDWLSQEIAGVDVMVTRVRAKIQGSSGVHEAGRAIDFRDEFGGRTLRLYSESEVDRLCNAINALFPRDDGFNTILHHSFRGGPKHFHLQIPIEWADSE